MAEIPKPSCVSRNSLLPSLTTSSVLKSENFDQDTDSGISMATRPPAPPPVVPSPNYVSMVQEAIASLSLGSSCNPDGCSRLHVLLYILHRFRPTDDIAVIITKLNKAMAFLVRMGILQKNLISDYGQTSSDDSDHDGGFEHYQPEDEVNPETNVIQKKKKKKSDVQTKRKKIQLGGEQLPEKKTKKKSDVQTKTKKIKLDEEQLSPEKKTEKKSDAQTKTQLDGEQEKVKPEENEIQKKKIQLDEEQLSPEKKAKTTSTEKLRESGVNASGEAVKVVSKGRLKSLSPSLAAIVGAQEMHRYEVIHTSGQIIFRTRRRSQ